MPRYLDLDRWPRRAAFDFFRGYAQPHFSVCAPVDVTALVERCRAPGEGPFSLALLHLALRAANACEPFRYRLEGGRVRVHDRLHCATTTLLAGERLAFLYFDYDDDFATFRAGAERARRALEAARGGASGTSGAGGGPGAPDAIDARDERTDLIHFTNLPWIAFTSVTHARSGAPEVSVPKIAFGQHHPVAGDRRHLPISVEVHHALMDGLHLSHYLTHLQQLLT
jgi:chloramphenicol O-acetyltransferase type A